VTGQAVLWVSRRLLHAESVSLIVAPAVADLEHESSTRSLLTRARGHVAVWVAFGGAVWHELVWDPRGADWTDHFSGIVTILFVLTSYHVALATLLLGFGNWKRVSILIVLDALDSEWALTAITVVVLVATVAQHARWRALADRSLAPKPDA
jgi:hypothetical protein